ncbi:MULTISPECIES: bile acid:sodium symporter family protein [Mesobacillus]|uniref:Bile acid:sodium symporter family protein n=1 Tax=Mesobacillus selenatarsenatis TaxID=388741 RepID=A0A846TEW3_9BACI|nr:MULTISPECIES: bile acid:sodium symporter family protein [Mesobacillus]NKE03872.1 bile acid:sodium symporter family protein [Mesobacillus selenatarsenatis]
MGIDQVTLNFNSATLTIMNILIGFIMFGVALDLKVDDFKRTLSTPKPVLIGLIAQFFLLPAFTFLLVMIVKPLPSIALGLFLVAACPGGNLSNFLTYLGKGNTPLSISMSAISTVLAIFMTPFNTLFWGSLYPGTNELVRSFSISPIDMLVTIFIMLGVPLVAGMYIGYKYPGWASRTNKWMKRFSIIFFILFVLASLASNFTYFLDFVGMVAIVVFLHNLVAILLGYFSSRVAGLPEKDRRAIAIEVGIQNSGLGLILIFNFFDGLGGMAIVAAWWAIWHIVSGLSLATFWSKREPENTAINGGIQV